MLGCPSMEGDGAEGTPREKSKETEFNGTIRRKKNFNLGT